MKYLVYGFLLCVFQSVSGQPYLFINQQQGSTVTVFDAQNFNEIKTIPTLQSPAGIAISDQDNWFAISYPESGMISFFDTDRLIPLEHMAVGGNPFGLTVQQKNLFYTDWHNNIVGVIDTATSRIIKKIPVGKSPAGLSISPCKKMLWVANRESNSVSLIDTEQLTVIKTIPVGTAPFDIHSDRQHTYVVNTQSNDLTIIDNHKQIEIKRIPVGRMPYGVVSDNTNHRLYVSNQMENSVSVIEKQSWKTIQTIKTGSYPENLAVDDINHRLFVLNWFDATMSVFDTLKFKRIHRIKLQEGSRAFGRFHSAATKEISP